MQALWQCSRQTASRGGNACSTIEQVRQRRRGERYYFRKLTVFPEFFAWRKVLFAVNMRAE
tara:strand:+ start:7094 stop:7276 length:183 start_codon:yes stop_codon:yes gene_type:complete